MGIERIRDWPQPGDIKNPELRTYATALYEALCSEGRSRVEDFQNALDQALTGATALTHKVLSATHSDSTAASAVRGDLIIGSTATPKWTRLAVGAGTTYLAGGTEPSWATLNQAAVDGLKTADGPTFVTVKCSGLTDGYIPYHVSDAAGFANGPLKSDVDLAINVSYRNSFTYFI